MHGRSFAITRVLGKKFLLYKKSFLPNHITNITVCSILPNDRACTQVKNLFKRVFKRCPPCFPWFTGLVYR